MQEILIDITKVCRTCLKESSDLRSIFCEDLKQNEKLSSMISFCTETEVYEDDEFPHQICSKCVQDVRIAYLFKVQCQVSYNTLKDYLPNPSKSDRSRTEKSIQTEEITFYPCEQCDLKFMNDKDIRAHRLTHKNDLYTFTCKSCSKCYTRLTHLQRHIAVAHPDLASKNAISKITFYKCTYCNKQFSRSDHLKRHIQTRHNAEGCVTVEINVDDASPDDFIREEDITESVTDKSPITQVKDEPIYPDPFDVEKNEIKEEEIATETLDSEVMNCNYYDGLDKTGEEYVDFTVTHEIVTEYEGEPIVEKIDEIPVNNEEVIDNNDGEYIPDDESIFRETRKTVKRCSTREKKATNKVDNNEKAAPAVDEVNTDDTKTFCDICEKNFKDSATYKTHSRVHLQKQPDIHKCDDCDKTFTRKTHLRRHMLTHSSNKPFKCPHCDKTFSRSEHLNTHISIHTGNKSFSCTLCDKSFVRSDHLRRHTESIHSPNPIVPQRSEVCEICKKAFTTSRYLQIHMKSHLRDSRTHNCKFCSNQFPTKASLTEHMKCHVNERPFLCSECGLRFVRNDYLVIHMRRHKGEKPYKCKFCGKGFPRATDLTVHERYHTGEKTHLCTICGKGFQRAYNLLVHTRVHTGERPYQCPHCVKSFAQGNDLKAHIRRHTGERYKCEICGDGFIQGYHLTQHKRTIHGLNAQSHIRRVEKFITPTAQQKQVMMHQQELQLDALKLKHSNLHTQKQELESNLELKDAEAESEVIKLEKEMFEIENQMSVIQKQHDELNQLQHLQDDTEEPDTQSQGVESHMSVDDLSGDGDGVTVYSTFPSKVKIPAAFE